MSTALPIDSGERGQSAAPQKAMLLLAAVALNAVELAFPRLPFLPWLKPGFANIITVLWVIRFGFKDAVLFTALRIWISGFYFGFSLFSFSLSLSGGLLSTVAMSALWSVLGKRGLVGTVGMAVTGALFHNAGQLAVVYIVMSRNMSLFGQIPFMLGAAVVFGGIVGTLAPVVARIIDNVGDDSQYKIGNDSNDGNDGNVNQYKVSNGYNKNIESINPGIGNKDNSSYDNINTNQRIKSIDKFIIAMTFAVSISLMFISSVSILLTAAILFSVISLILNPNRPAILLYPAKFYILFLFIAFTHLFFSYGTRVDALPFVTKEGLTAFASQSLRLWCWLQTAHIFKKFRFHELFIQILYRFFPNKKDTLKAGMTALEHFPEIVRIARSEKKIPVVTLLLKPKTALTGYISAISCRISRIIGRDYSQEMPFNQKGSTVEPTVPADRKRLQ